MRQAVGKEHWLRGCICRRAGDRPDLPLLDLGPILQFHADLNSVQFDQLRPGLTSEGARLKPQREISRAGPAAPPPAGGSPTRRRTGPSPRRGRHPAKGGGVQAPLGHAVGGTVGRGGGGASSCRQSATPRRAGRAAGTRARAPPAPPVGTARGASHRGCLFPPPPPPPPSPPLVLSGHAASPHPRTNRTRCVPHPVLNGHAASLTPVTGRGDCDPAGELPA